ncbi:rhodanese-like domain-containing protein [Aquimarina sp. U1-2]|uniref:rhodanese-like domain-containing protein n=1 Tax=Aquimarina sp. U1-2 TaxID=2823141 RepID=UPI001AECABA7|nr:rhodanese-like domain-containing protein [Aquimarina sp. U1-2]MBP2831717.1 rhodanese-like domain-containing protein [Aquimarina sp. U1-2]
MNSSKHYVLYIWLLFSTFGTAQDSLKEVLKTYNEEHIPYISAAKLFSIRNRVHILDAREKEEFNVSHIQNAIHVGYENFTLKTAVQPYFQKNDTLVVYCSLGVRSEDVSEQFKKVGFTHVLNLYGGIFEWKNHNYPIVNSKGQTTDSVHAFSKQWAKWLHNGKKVYSN